MKDGLDGQPNGCPFGQLLGITRTFCCIVVLNLRRCEVQQLLNGVSAFPSWLEESLVEAFSYGEKPCSRFSTTPKCQFEISGIFGKRWVKQKAHRLCRCALSDAN